MGPNWDLSGDQNVRGSITSIWVKNKANKLCRGLILQTKDKIKAVINLVCLEQSFLSVSNLNFVIYLSGKKESYKFW